MKPHTCKCSMCHSSGVILPGWVCSNCSGFNGAAKEVLPYCRACGTPRPVQARKDARKAKRETRNAKLKRLFETGNYTVEEVAKLCDVSRSTAYEILRT